MINKAKVQEQLNILPNEFSIEVLIDKLILIEKIEEGEAQSLNGETISSKEMDIEIAKWFE